ncbi:hypothetical protein [Marinococcus luteus]|uniref:hypothetical protein n=1 Tax=Marinococcus luteus TaxID=1122204 RepID=UPI002ACD1F1C|nr:hypothetical protein [Marinococcus luteus]MDZ5782123.1 hypothetical protein [Marinococcus luteus]
MLIAVNEDKELKAFIESVIDEADLSITDIAYEYDPEEDWYYIFHNFSDKIMEDKVFAEIIGKLTYEKLILRGIKNFVLLEDKEELAKLTKSYFDSITENEDFMFTTMANGYVEMAELSTSISAEFDAIDDNLLIDRFFIEINEKIT